MLSWPIGPSKFSLADEFWITKLLIYSLQLFAKKEYGFTKDNFDEAMKIKKKYKLKLKIVKVEKFSDAIDYLNKLKK